MIEPSEQTLQAKSLPRWEPRNFRLRFA